MNLDNIKKVYFIGIGGSSMSSLAQIMQKRDFIVAGSDMQQSHASDNLIEKGITVFIGHKEENIKDFAPEIVIKTDAILPTNPELLYAEESNIPVYRRAELLGNLLDGYKKTIGVAGTHGKTTTSSMITSIFLDAQKNPSAIIGGQMKQTGTSYIIGSEDLCIFESCEYKCSFYNFFPTVSVLLNIAKDHMEFFKTEENLLACFTKYLDNTKPDGIVVYNAEDENSLKVISGYKGKTVSFGLEKGNFIMDKATLTGGFPKFDIIKNGAFFCHVDLRVPGRHNVKNALAAAAAADAAGLCAEDIGKGLSDYAGAGRRFEYHCTINGAVVADDYGHHPDAYRVTFNTARDLGFKRIIAIHQPHTFSRTKMMMNEFVDVLKTVDKVLIPPIYPARETNDEYNIYAEDVVKRLPNAEYMNNFNEIADRIKELAQPGDLFITLGCGDIYKAAELTAKKYGEKIDIHY
ncbi:MAG: UDP-N-acetylmuramate--L-alanine ligase [Clostridiales bacterium]|nr:MAG: UDP-N-acetylmuramate--L-alanine ligase [Clostridiales bacterium]